MNEEFRELFCLSCTPVSIKLPTHQREVSESTMTHIPDADVALYAVSRNNQRVNAKWLIDQGANIEYALGGAADGGDVKMVEWVIRQGAKDLDCGYAAARMHGQEATAEFIKECIRQTDPEFGAFLDMNDRRETHPNYRALAETT